jgi:hypothetical protein
VPKAEIPVKYAQAVVKGSYGPTTWVNVLYFSIPGLVDVDVLLAADDVGSAAIDLYNKLGYAHFSSGWKVSSAKVLIRDSGGSAFRSVTIADAPGTDSSGDQDAQVAYLINWYAGDVRRGGKPRQYICGVPMDACADSATLTSTFLGAMNSGLSDWFTELGDGSLPHSNVLELVEMSFIDAKAYRTTPVAYPITSGQVNPVVATQRRRIDRLRG